jgi:DNA-binding XRE family transcriptional regulator
VINTQLLKAAIVQKGMTQAEVATKIGISYQSLSDKINNKTEFKIDEASALCTLLDISERKDEIFFAK